MKELTGIQAMQEALIEEMTRDEKVLLIGESIQGGSFGLTTGLTQQFGRDRVVDTPISETAIAGGAIGLATAGYRPIVDFMFSGFMYVAGDEVLMKAGQWRFLHGGDQQVPLVYLGCAGAGFKLANEHSLMPAAAVLHSPGLKVVVPSTPYNAKGLLKTAIRDNNPVIFLWHLGLLGATEQIPEEEYIIPFGKADIKRQGADVTVVSYSLSVHQCLGVAQELEGSIDVEVIDLQTLEPLDIDAVMKSVEKTGKLVIVDEDMERCGFAGELACQVMEKGFDLLDAPIQRVCRDNMPIPGGLVEDAVLPGPVKVVDAIKAVMA